MKIDLNDFKNKYKIKCNYEIPWVDLDHSGYINHSNYLRYFEFARMKYFSNIGFMNYSDGIGPIMKSIKNVNFIKPLTYPDEIEIGITIDKNSINDYSFDIEHCIFSKKQNAITTIGTVVIFSYHYGIKKKIKLPDDIRDKIHKDIGI